MLRSSNDRRNLLTGAFTRRDGRAAIGRDLEAIYAYFPKLKERRDTLAGFASGGEQQMCAIGRAMMSRPKMILLDEPSMGLAPQILEEIYEIVKGLNLKEGVCVSARRTERQFRAPLREFRLYSRKWTRRARRRSDGASRQ